MKEQNGKIDNNDLQHINRLGFNNPVLGIPAPFVEGKINPHLTRFKLKNGKTVDVFHIKPIYYKHLNGQWRPMEEVAEGFGNSWITLKENWEEKMDLRYLRWLQKRMETIKAKLGVCVPMEQPIKVRRDKILVPLK